MENQDNRITAPVYAQIALDIALRITRGELKENTKVYGRSVMASEYGVSPETVRRAVKLLEDVGIMETRQNSGSRIISAAKAKEYVDKFSRRNEVRAYRKQLADLLAEQEALGRDISQVAEAIIRINEKFSDAFPFPIYETDVPAGSPLCGRTLGELNFWQQTMATVIAIRRGEQIILSPGPYAALGAGDTLVFIGELKCVEAVNALLRHDRRPVRKTQPPVE